MSHVDPLLTPFTLKGLTLANRIVSTSHEPAYSDDGLPGERYRAYHVEKARGGVGLTMIGGSALVSPESAPAFGNLQLWRDEAVPLLRRLCDEVHEHGTAVMTQLTHLGHRTSNYTHDWLPAVSVSEVREPAHRAFTRAAEEWDLDRIVDDFVATAQRCEAAGLDGIELMAYGHLLDAFWSPSWNRREDEYGGSYENRMRFPLRVVSAIREAVGDAFVLGIRMSFDEERENGLATDEAIAIAQDVTAAGIDVVSVIKGFIGSDAELARMIPPMGTPSSPHLEFAGQIRAKLDVPVMHAAKIADVATARHAISAGLLDLVGMTRALLADPELPRKVASGRTDEVRPCVGANMCIDGIYTSGAAHCIHNPATGRELEIPHRVPRASRARTVAVVGGGPAGLEAARVLGERGHAVTLFEANSSLGGQVRLAATSVRRRDLLGIVDWRVAELARLGVVVRRSTYVEADELLAGDWDAVVVATGGVPAQPDVPGGHLAVDTWDLLAGTARPSGRVLVYDDHGGNQALDAVEALLARGPAVTAVELATPERAVSPDVGGLVAAGYFDLLDRAGVRISVLRRLRSLRREGGDLVARFGLDGSDHLVECRYDAVVAEMGTEPVRDLYEGLLPASSNRGEVDFRALLAGEPQRSLRNPEGRLQVFRVGDAVASRNVHAAILDAARLCRAM